MFNARRTAEYYLSAIPGFRDYPCTHKITEKAVIGTIGSSGKVYMIWGWNEDENGNETDIWSSSCYADCKEAQSAMDAAKRRMNKQEWSLDTYLIGQCHWTEGFERIFDAEHEVRPDRQTLLPRGITGFWSVDAEPLPFLDEKVFRQMCHALARENGAAVSEVNTDTAARNFYYAGIQKYDAPVFILQNIYYPYAAFAQRDTADGFVLTDQPEWLQLPESSGHFLRVDALNQDWHSLCGELSPEELEQVRYWKAQTVGEIIFNHWD